MRHRVLGSGNVMKMTCCNGVRPISDNLNVRRGVGRRLQTERFLPLAAFQGVNSWRHGLANLEVIQEFGIGGGVWISSYGVCYRLGICIVTDLKIGVFEEVQE